jgi:Holliday junction resolvase RusA-like endonuclease
VTEFDGVISQAPLGKGRPRAVNAGKHARVYTPPATAQWEFFAANELRTAWGDAPPFKGALACEIVAVFTRTAELLRHTKAHGWKYSEGRIAHPVKPDLDNVIKATLDAAEKARIFNDDKQVSTITASKFYAALGEPAHVELRLWRVS